MSTLLSSSSGARTTVFKSSLPAISFDIRSVDGIVYFLVN
jgi:hypothetical protein